METPYLKLLVGYPAPSSAHTIVDDVSVLFCYLPLRARRRTRLDLNLLGITRRVPRPVDSLLDLASQTVLGSVELAPDGSILQGSLVSMDSSFEPPPPEMKGHDA